MTAPAQQPLWRDIAIEKYMRPSKHHLAQLFRFSGGCTSTIRVKDWVASGLDSAVLVTLLRMSEEVTHFELRSSRPQSAGQLSATPGVLSKCSTLVLDQVLDENANTLSVLMDLAAPSLTTLSIRGLPMAKPRLGQPQHHLTNVKIIGLQRTATDLVCPASHAPAR